MVLIDFGHSAAINPRYIVMVEKRTDDNHPHNEYTLITLVDGKQLESGIKYDDLMKLLEKAVV